MTRILLAVFLFAVSSATATSQIKLPDPRFQEKLQITTRVAVVHVAHVMAKYDKAVQFNKELQAMRMPFNKQIQMQRDHIAKWQKSIDALDFTASTRSELQSKIEAAQTELKKVTADCDAATDKLKAENMPRLWKDMHEAIRKMASANRIDIVLGHGDAMEDSARNLPPTAANLFPAINRKMQAMDSGSSVPLHMSAKCDATDAVIELLNQRATGKATRKKAIGADRISIVNIGYVFNHHNKAKKFKAGLEEAFEPYKLKARKLSDDLAACDRAINAGDFTVETLDQLQVRKAQAKKLLEELSSEIQRELGKIQESNLVELWKDVERGIANYSDRASVDIVLGHGDPLEKGMLDLFPNINRKMQAMDAGGLVPLFASTKMDIAEPVTEWLNKQLMEKDAPDTKKTPVPATNPIVVMQNIGYVFNHYDRAQAFKKELEDSFGPYKAKAAAISKNMQSWEASLRNRELTEESKEVLIKKIRNGKRELEDLGTDMQQKLGRKQEENLTTLWKEVQVTNEKVATLFGIDLVLGFGEPLDEKGLGSIGNIQRKMTVMETGAAVPLYIAPTVDLGPAVTTTMNRWVSGK